MRNELPRLSPAELGTLDGLTSGEFVTVPRTKIVIAVCTDGDWDDFLVVKRGMLTRDAEELKRALDRRVREHIESGKGKRVDFIHGNSELEVLSLSKVRKVKIPEVLKRQLGFSLDKQSENPGLTLLARLANRIGLSR